MSRALYPGVSALAIFELNRFMRCKRKSSACGDIPNALSILTSAFLGWFCRLAIQKPCQKNLFNKISYLMAIYDLCQSFDGKIGACGGNFAARQFDQPKTQTTGRENRVVEPLCCASKLLAPNLHCLLGKCHKQRSAAKSVSEDQENYCGENFDSSDHNASKFGCDSDDTPFGCIVVSNRMASDGEASPGRGLHRCRVSVRCSIVACS